MTTYRYLAADLRTGAPLADLPLTGATIDDELNEPGSMSATLPLYGLDPATVTKLRSVTLPGRTALYVVADEDQVLWGGIVWKRRLRQHALTLEASGFLSYYAKSRILTDLTFTGVDQLDIARALFAHAHAQTGGDIGVDLGAGTSGVVRDRAYLGIDRKTVWEAVRDLTTVDDAFDVAIDCALATDGSVARRLTFGYPYRGRPPGNPDLLIDYPGNASDWEWPEEGDRMTNAVYVRGDMDTVTGVAAFGEAVDMALIGAGYPRLADEFPAASGSTTQLTVDQQAAAFLAVYRHPVTLPTFTIPSGAHTNGPHPTEYTAGDWFRVRVTDPEWFPAGPQGQPGLDVPMRAVRRSITLSGGHGGESTDLTFNPYPASAAIIS